MSFGVYICIFLSLFLRLNEYVRVDFFFFLIIDQSINSSRSFFLALNQFSFQPREKKKEREREISSELQERTQSE